MFGECNFNIDSRHDGPTDLVRSSLARYASFMDSIVEVLKKNDADGDLGESIAVFSESLREGLTNSCDSKVQWYVGIFENQELCFGEDLLNECIAIFSLWERITYFYSREPFLTFFKKIHLSHQEFRSAYYSLLESVTSVRSHYKSSISDALKNFSDSLRSNDNLELTSLSSIYDLWIDIAEAAYRDVIMTQTFSKDFGNMVNSTSGTKKAIRNYRVSICALVGSLEWQRVLDNKLLTDSEEASLQSLLVKLEGS